ncbi:Uncharacterised protein [Bordetella pertussis]|nr:Uncharacterised protein [Bordetella pertussis]
MRFQIGATAAAKGALSTSLTCMPFSLSCATNCRSPSVIIWRCASRHLSAAAWTILRSSAEMRFQIGLETIRLAGPHT